MKRILVIILVHILFLFPFSLIAAERGYGDWLVDYPGHPEMRERRILVLTNSCRFAPTEYRDKYIGNYNILLPKNYPSTNALYWHIDLNRVARLHAKDMADNHGLNHHSSDSTPCFERIRKYYKKSGTLAENIATGGKDAWHSMKQWIMDGNPDPAPDNSGKDGHRRGIMNSRYKELGAGYAYGKQKYYHFWVQDFSGGTPDYDNPISGAAHFIMSQDSTQFIATYKDPQGGTPQKATVNIDNTEYSLTILLGQATKGTFHTVLGGASDCRYYYFVFTDSQNKTWRHPEFGRLVTLGEGSCDKEYEPPGSTFDINLDSPINTRSLLLTISKNHIAVNLSNLSPNQIPDTYAFITNQGKILAKSAINKNDNRHLVITENQFLATGIYGLIFYKNNLKIFSTMVTVLE